MGPHYLATREVAFLLNIVGSIEDLVKMGINSAECVENCELSHDSPIRDMVYCTERLFLVAISSRAQEF